MKLWSKLMLFTVLIPGVYFCTNVQENYFEGKEVFINVTERAGLSFIRDSFSSCWGDINGDGLQDLFVINHYQKPILFRNNNGMFKDVTDSSGINTAGDQHGCAIGDYDNDGDQDIYVTIGAAQGRGRGSNRLYQNNGNGIFTDKAVSANVDYPKGRGRTVSWIDYDNDGFLDLFIANAKREGAPSVLFRNNGDGSFTDVSVQSRLNMVDNSGRSSWVDYNNDGFIDLTILKARKDENHLIEIYRNIRGEKFEKSVTFHGWTYAWGDYDNDGDLDIFISVSPRYYIFRAQYEFSLLAKIFRGFNTLYENRGNDTFVDVSDRAGLKNIKGGDKPVFFDYDNDGDLDVYLVISGTKGENTNDILLENKGDKTFTHITNKIGLFQQFGGRGRGVAYSDYDDDGFLDLFLTNGLDRGGLVTGRDSGPYVLYRNAGNDNHWLKIRLIGKRSNRDGIGSHVKLYIGERLQYRQHNGGIEGYVQHGNPIHFGLGQAGRVDRIEIIWPSGTVDNMTDVQVDQTLVINEHDRDAISR